MKNICKILLGVILLLLVLSMCACSKQQPVTNTISDNAKDTVNAIVANKPECKDVGNVCNQQIDTVVASCNLELDKLSVEKHKWKWSFFGLIIVIGVFITKKVML